MGENFEWDEPASPIEAGKRVSGGEPAPTQGVAGRFLNSLSGYVPDVAPKDLLSMVPTAITAGAEAWTDVPLTLSHAAGRFSKFYNEMAEEDRKNLTPEQIQLAADFGVELPGKTLAEYGGSQFNKDVINKLAERKNDIRQFKEEELPKISTLKPEGFASKLAEIAGQLPVGFAQSNPVIAYVMGYGKGGVGEGLKQATIALGSNAVMKTLQGSPTAWKLINDQAKKMGLKDVTRDNIESILTSSASQRIGSALVNAAVTGYEGGGLNDVMASMFTGAAMPTGKMKPEYKNRLRANIRDAANEAMGVRKSDSAKAVAFDDPEMVVDVITDRMRGIKDGTLTLSNRDDTVTARKPETVFETIKLGAERTKQLNEQQRAIAEKLQGNNVQPQLLEKPIADLDAYVNEVKSLVTNPNDPLAAQLNMIYRKIRSVQGKRSDIDFINSVASDLEAHAASMDKFQSGDLMRSIPGYVNESYAAKQFNTPGNLPIDIQQPRPLGATERPATDIPEGPFAAMTRTTTGDKYKQLSALVGERDAGISQSLMERGGGTPMGDQVRAIANELRRAANTRGEVVDLTPQAQVLRAEAESAVAKSKTGASKRLLDAADELEKVRYKPIDEVLGDIAALNAESANYFKSKEVGSDATANADQYARGLQLKALQSALKQKLSQIDPAMGDEFNNIRENMRKQIEVDSLLTDTYIKAAGDTTRTSGFNTLFHRGSEANAAYALWSLFTKSKDSKIIKAFNNAEKLVDVESGSAKVDKYKPVTAPGFSQEPDQELY